MADQPLRIGFIGSGFIAGVHAAALRRLPGVELAGVVSRRLEAAAVFAAKHGVTTVYPHADALLADDRLDALYVCLPPFAHAGEVERAAAQGLHLFLEKPIALGADRARVMVEAIERAGVVSQVGFHLRFRRAVRHAKALLEQGTAGRPTLFTGRYWTNMDGAPWWRDRARSGGQVYEQVIHLYDLARHLCGDVERATGLVRHLGHGDRPEFTIEDTSVGTLEFRNGALGSITGSNCAIPLHFIADFRLVCERLTLDYRCTGQPWVTPDAATLHRVPGGAETLVEDEDPYQLESADFIAAIRAGRPAATPAREGLAAIELVEAVLASPAA